MMPMDLFSDMTLYDDCSVAWLLEVIVNLMVGVLYDVYSMGDVGSNATEISFVVVANANDVIAFGTLAVLDVAFVM